MPETPKPTLKPDWTLPEPPPGGPFEPYAYLVGGDDGWELRWIPKDCDDPGEADYFEGCGIAWPFGNDDLATIADFEAIGFRAES